MSAKPKRGTCDWCEKRRLIRFYGVLRQFCSATCANAYLSSEGFSHRVEEPPKQKRPQSDVTLGGKAE